MYVYTKLTNSRSLPVLKKGKPSGEVKVDFHYFPVNVADKQEDGVIIPPEESSKFELYAYLSSY